MKYAGYILDISKWRLDTKNTLTSIKRVYPHKTVLPKQNTKHWKYFQQNGMLTLSSEDFTSILPQNLNIPLVKDQENFKRSWKDDYKKGKNIWNSKQVSPDKKIVIWITLFLFLYVASKTSSSEMNTFWNTIRFTCRIIIHLHFVIAELTQS